MEQTIQEKATSLRAEVQALAESVMKFKNDTKDVPTQQGESREEVMANITLAYRHLEDAKMRLGKVIQAVDGVSVYDTPANN